MRNFKNLNSMILVKAIKPTMKSLGTRTHVCIDTHRLPCIKHLRTMQIQSYTNSRTLAESKVGETTSQSFFEASITLIPNNILQKK